jgi:5-methylcytosine-specific restriction endonuclease McrA
MSYGALIIIIIVVVILVLIKRWHFETNRKRRRDYYRDVYLKSEAWQRKRYLVLKRDNWRCVYCGSKATQVHHKRYAKYNIGKEPIDWLVSVCKSCHDSQHQ